MSSIIPFQFESTSIRVVADEHGKPLFVGKDVCEALGYADHTNAMKQHCRGVAKHHPITDSLGRMQETRVLTEPDVFRLAVKSELPGAERFEAWVFEDVLPTIRKTGRYESPQYGLKDLAQQTPAITAALKLVPLVVRAARALGLDKNAAALSANQAVTKMTGTNVMGLLGVTHLKAENQESLVYTPSELGMRIGLSGRKFNALLAEAGLQEKRGDYWVPMPAATGLFRVMDTGKRHNDGTMIQQIKWTDNTLNLISKDIA